jgi:hypothetical protein
MSFIEKTSGLSVSGVNSKEIEFINQAAFSESRAKGIRRPLEILLRIAAACQE